MKKYTAPSLRVMEILGDDIRQTSGEGVTAEALPTVVVTGASGTTREAKGYQSTSFTAAYGMRNITD